MRVVVLTGGLPHFVAHVVIAMGIVNIVGLSCGVGMQVLLLVWQGAARPS